MREDKKLFLSLLQVSFANVLLLVIGELAGPFVQRILHLPVEDMTILFAPAGFGLVLGGVLMPLFTRYMSTRRTITIGSIFTAVGLILLPLSQVVAGRIAMIGISPLFVVGVVAFIIGIALDMVNIPAQTVMQERAREEERARVLSFQFMFYNAGSIPVLLFAGVISDTLGIDTVMYGLGAAVLAFQLWTIRYNKTAAKAS